MVSIPNPNLNACQSLNVCKADDFCTRTLEEGILHSDRKYQSALHDWTFKFEMTISENENNRKANANEISVRHFADILFYVGSIKELGREGSSPSTARLFSIYSVVSIGMYRGI